MKIDWTKPNPACKMCDGQGYKDHEGFCMDLCDCEAPPKPQIGPEHIEALEFAEHFADGRRIASGLLARNCQSARGKKVHEDRVWRFSETVARLAEIRAYLESL